MRPESVRLDRTCEHCGDGAHGRPRFIGSDLQLSLSSCGNAFVLALSDNTVGVDIEAVHRVSDPAALSNFIFASRERSEYEKLDPSRRLSYVTRAWSRKEAVGKAAGKGIVEAAGIEVLGGTVCYDQRDWTVWTFDLPDDHYLSLATLGRWDTSLGLRLGTPACFRP